MFLFFKNVTPQCCSGSWQLHAKVVVVVVFFFLFWRTTPLKITLKTDSSSSVDTRTTHKCHHQNSYSTEQCVSTALSSYWQDGEVFYRSTVQNHVNILCKLSPWLLGQNTHKTCQVIIILIFLHCQKGTIGVNNEEFNYFSYGIWF